MRVVGDRLLNVAYGAENQDPRPSRFRDLDFEVISLKFPSLKFPKTTFQFEGSRLGVFTSPTFDTTSSAWTPQCCPSSSEAIYVG